MKHRAEGLYFPDFKALCIDVYGRQPSFTNSVTCMITATASSAAPQPLSGAAQIPALTEDTHISRLDPQDSLVKQWKGKTKYSSSYYLNPAEAFARCGEIYFSEILGKESSIVPEPHGFEYPDEPEFRSLIRQYFSGLRMRKAVSA